MGKIKVITNVTLDGVMQSPARPEEDPRDGFRHGGWGAPYAAMVFGSGLLVQSLMRWNLMDELTLLIHPLILGSGRRLFPSGGVSAVLQLRNAKTTSNGVVIVTYQLTNK